LLSFPVTMERLSSFSLLLVGLLLLCVSLTVSLSPCLRQSDCALTVVENSEEGEGGAVGSEESQEEVTEVVQPSEQWKTLSPGQAVPAGSHVRLNLQTGQREVRLGEEQLKYWTEEHRCVGRGHLIHDVVCPLFISSSIMRRLLEQFNNSSSTTEQRLKVLLELEYLVHQVTAPHTLTVDNAQSLCSLGGLPLVLQGLNSSDVRLQENSAFVLGSALSSNPAVQVQAVEGGALQMLLTALATAQPLRVKKKVLFAVAALLRHFPHAQLHFLSKGGFQVLTELFRADAGGVLRARIVTMLYDMISEKLMSQSGLDLVSDESHQERVRQYHQVPVEAELLEKGWCGLAPQLLQSTEHDHREKALRALLAMAPTCWHVYRSDTSLLGSLRSLQEQYHDMVQSEMIIGEESSYYADILELVQALQVRMK
uniref:Nucleotide exchange factor SIL1 n=1 Tax=Cynoglossus semilaevis TaxID=244447 RepID=A0A3P8X430_CYNSE